MRDNAELLELRIESEDDETYGEVSEALVGLDVERWPRTRFVDPVTVISVAGGVVALVNGLLALKDRWDRRHQEVPVTVHNEAGDYVDLRNASREDLLRLLGHSAQEAEPGS